MPLRPGSADKVVHFGACLVLLPAASGFVMGSAEAGIGMLIVFGAPLYFFSLDSPITALSAPVRLAAMASFSATGVLLGAFPPGGSDAPLLARLGTALPDGGGGRRGGPAVVQMVADEGTKGPARAEGSLTRRLKTRQPLRARVDRTRA